MSFLALILYLLLANLSYAYELTSSEYKALKRMTEEIKSYCPPSDCIYIGVGRSPTPLIAILESDNENKTIHLPLTYGREFKDEGRDITPNERKRLFKHFETFIPIDSDFKKKRILLIDFTLTGEGLNSANEHLNEWINSKKLNFNLSQFAIDLIGDDDTPTRKYISLSDDFSEISEQFVLKKYSQYSRYEQFNVSLSDLEDQRYIPPNKNPAYHDLKVEGTPLALLKQSCNLKVLNQLRF